MRVISGSARGANLASVPGNSTRPITDRVKEALFNIIGAGVIGKSFLDLFAGTGAVGIEALSRGAESAVFLDTNYRAYQTILANLKTTGLDPYAMVYKKDAFVFLRGEPTDTFDFIYIAPPQYKGLWHLAMEGLANNPGWMAPDSVCIVQIDPKELKEAINYTNFLEFDRRRYGDTLLLFFNYVLM